ncbi:hypothetical protein HUU51_01665 [Candidatus Gracilibacteria bacterium]|nr:hypothetical protein [Candidatus Gracilibacteria bacterium]
MGKILGQGRFPKHNHTTPQNIDFTVLGQNIVLLKKGVYPEKINSFVEEIIERINIVIKGAINDFTQQFNESGTKFNGLSTKEELSLSEEMTKLFNEMLLSALLFSEEFGSKMKSKNITITNDVKLMYIYDSLQPYKERITQLLNNTFTQKKYSFLKY